MSDILFIPHEPGTVYRPSNGDEGMFFTGKFCDRCQRDAAYRHDEGDSCPIIAWAMAVEPEHPKYPREWVYGPDGQPTCTAFEPEGDERRYRCPNTPDLFS